MRGMKGGGQGEVGSPTWGEEWDLKEDGVEKPEGSNPPGPSPAPPGGGPYPPGVGL